MKATEKYFPVIPIIMLYEVVLTFKSVEKILKCDFFPMKAAKQYFSMALLVFRYFTKLTKFANFYKY